MMRHKDRSYLPILVILSLAAALTLPGRTAGRQGPQRQPPQVGPPDGALVIVGGAMRDPAIVEAFLDLAGGPDAPIVVIPTASGRDEYDEWNSGLRVFKRNGATNLTVLHTNDRAEADSEEFVEPIRRARGVWFGGGRQWRLADSYLDTRVHEELWSLLERDGVIGGSSAGATIQGSYLARGDTGTNTIMMGDHVEGLGFLKESAIDQHLLARNRQFDLVEVVETHPELLGIGIDENTAIVVRGDEFEVLGRGYVAIYDHDTWVEGGPAGEDGPGGDGGPFYFLSPGQRFDLANRQPLRVRTTIEPLERRIVERSWRRR